MIKNIISVGYEEEIELLRAASIGGVTTGGWTYNAPTEQLGLKNKNYRGYKNAYLDNLRTSDLTVVLSMPGPLPPRLQRCKNWILNHRNSKPITTAFLSVAEIPAVIEQCKTFSVEVLNFVFLSGVREKNEAAQGVGYFVEDFLTAAGDLVVKDAPNIWSKEERLRPLRRRRKQGANASGFYSVTHTRYLPAMKQTVQREITSLISGLPLDPAVKWPLIKDAIANCEKELQSVVATNDSLDSKTMQGLWQGEVYKSLTSHFRKLPKRKSRFLEHIARFLVRDPEPVQNNQLPHPLDPDLFMIACDIASRTSVRKDRYLRTFILLNLGGIARSKGATQTIKTMTRCAQISSLPSRWHIARSN